MLVSLRGTPTWRLHTVLCKFVQNIPKLRNRTDLNSTTGRTKSKIGKIRQTSKMITKTLFQWHEVQMRTSSYLAVRCYRLSQMHLSMPSSLQSQHNQFSVDISANFTEWFYSTRWIDTVVNKNPLF